MVGNGSPWNVWLVSIASSLPVIVVLITGLVACRTQRQRRPVVTRILTVVICFQLAMSLGLSLAIRALVMAAGQMLVDPTINDGWTRPLIMTLPFSCLAAFIWGPAFAAVLVVDDTAEG